VVLITLVALCQGVNMLNLNNGDQYITTMLDILLEKSVVESVEYISPFLNDAIILQNNHHILTEAIKKITLDGLHAEFGVFQGGSINLLSSNKNVQWYGFDSFLGLDEDWKGSFYGKGHFSMGGVPPKVNNNVELVVGRFQDTLPQFLTEHSEPFAFINIDCDTYESTKYVLDTIKKQLVVDTIISFDEYLAHPGWKISEHKAWQEFCKENNIKYEYLIFGRMQAVVRIKSIGDEGIK
jgi:hypothetical protein